MERKEFITLCKLYLASLTDRRAMDAFFNVSDIDGIVLANATKRKGKDVVEDNRIIFYRIGDLGLHLVNFKHQEFYTTLMNLLNIPPKKPYHVDIKKLLAVLDEIKDMDKLVSKILPNGDLALYNKDFYTIEDKYIIGSKVASFHSVRNIDRYIKENDYTNKKVLAEEVTSEPEIKKNKTYSITVNFSKFMESEDIHKLTRIISIDGLSSVSYKSFLKKIKAESHPCLKRLMWADNNLVRMIHTYEDDVIQVTSYRPNVFIFPLKKVVELDPNLKID